MFIYYQNLSMNTFNSPIIYNPIIFDPNATLQDTKDLIELLLINIKIKTCYMYKYPMDARLKEDFNEEIKRCMQQYYMYTNFPLSCYKTKFREEAKKLIIQLRDRAIIEKWYDDNIELPFGGIKAFGPKKRPFEEVATVIGTNKENNKLRLTINNSKENLDVFANNLRENFLKYFKEYIPLQPTQMHL